MFHPGKAKSFLHTAFEILVLTGLAAKGLEIAWSYFNIKTPELVWAYTVATGLASLYISMFICFSRQAVYQARIDEKAAYCAELEQKLLKKRLSSKVRN
jgi:hypothetical protein